MHTEQRLPVYAHWQEREYPVDVPENQTTPDVGTIIYLTVEINGATQRRPFKVTAKRQRTDDGGGAGLRANLGLGGARFPTAIDVDVDQHLLDE